MSRPTRRLARVPRRTALHALTEPARAVPALALLALALRLWGLGARTMHFDEARVGYWTLRYLETGRFAYRPIVHGPLLPLVTAPLLDAFGATDFVVRLVPAFAGAALPLSALALRGTLDDAEVTALAALLAANPLLVFFSRFFRADVPLALFAFGAFALGHRALATGRRRDLLAAGVLFGLALATKENALVYLGCVAGAAGVALGIRWWISGGAGVARALARARPLAPAVPAAVALGGGVAWFFYVPRRYSPGLSDLATRPVATLAAGTVGAWEAFVGSLWATGVEHAYLPFLAHLLGTVAVAAPALYACALVGTWTELRRLPRRPATRTGENPGGEAEADRTPADEAPTCEIPAARPVVLATAAWGLVSLAGYPVAADIKAPWLAVHAVVPLAVPGGVGAAWVVRRGRAWWRTDERGPSVTGELRDVGVSPASRSGRVRAAALACVVALLAAQLGFVVLATSYTSPVPRVNFIAQGAQPGDDLDPLVRDVEAARGEGGVLYYGAYFRLPNESVADVPPRENPPWLGLWLRRLPLAWYVERADVSHAQVSEPGALPADPPPVVIATPASAAEIAPRLGGYERTEYDLALYGNTVVAFTRPEAESGDGKAG